MKLSLAERQNRGHQPNNKNYNTLIRKYASKVLEMEQHLTGKYPIVYGKASDVRKIKMLNDFLEQDIDWEDDDYVRKKTL